MEKLEPKRRIFDLSSEIKDFAEVVGKRTGGGSAQIGVMSLEEIASTIVPVSSGFDKQGNTTWEGPTFALLRVMREYGWTPFDQAIIIADVQKYAVDLSDGFIPLAPKSIDVEANIEFSSEHRELQIYGDRCSPHLLLQKAVHEIVGFATEYGNGQDSLEVVIPLYTSGVWKRIEDIQFNRSTGMVIVTPYITLWCEDMSINKLTDMPTEVSSVKTLEAIKIAKHLCSICDIG